MKNTQKKTITRNYQLLTEVESGKCRRETAATDVTCDVMTQERGKTSLPCPLGGQRLEILSGSHSECSVTLRPKRFGDWRSFSF